VAYTEPSTRKKIYKTQGVFKISARNFIYSVVNYLGAWIAQSVQQLGQGLEE
jgi:hypothetical protein